jgi:hypothetical protein
MPLKFTPERAIYDAGRQIVPFLARDESRLVLSLEGHWQPRLLLIPWRNPIPSWFTGRSRPEFGRRRRRSIASAS